MHKNKVVDVGRSGYRDTLLLRHGVGGRRRRRRCGR